MRPKIGAAVHVGRIGAMAVTLGVGAAVAAGQGVAWADTPSKGSSAPDSSKTASASNPGTKPTSTGKPAHKSKTSASTSGDTNSTVKTPAPNVSTLNSPNKSTATEPAVAPPAKPVPPAPAAPKAAVVQTAAALTTTQPSTVVHLTETASAVIAPEHAAVTTPNLATALQAVPRLISSVLAAVGFAPPAANTPVAPAEPPMLWTLLAAARKEFERDTAPLAPTGAATSVAAAAVVSTAAVTTVPTKLPSTPVGWVTGQNNGSLNGKGVPQTNNTAGFNIYGTDLGIMWDNEQTGATHYILTAFGDTFSGPNMSGDWRSNVLVLSQDTKLYNGMTLLQTGPTYQFIPRAPRALGLFGSEVTIIPTSGVAVLGNQYVNYMSVKSWDTPGRWTTNYSAISEYNPTTDTWNLVPSTIRSDSWFGSSTAYVPGSQNFQQAAYVLEPEDQVGADGIRYLYAFGTPSGRGGSAYLSRVAQGDVDDLSQYQYWNGKSWTTGNPAAATAVIGTQTDTRPIIGWFVDLANNPNFFGGIFGGLLGAKQGGNVSEMSVQYNDYLGKYVVMYANGQNNVILRTADTPEGPWSTPITVATSAQYPGLYAPMIHPWSGTGELTDSSGQPDVNDLYWNMSVWGDYNVVMMQTDLSSLKATEV
jgi:hypothetical protein